MDEVPTRELRQIPPAEPAPVDKLVQKRANLPHVDLIGLRNDLAVTEECAPTEGLLEARLINLPTPQPGPDLSTALRDMRDDERY